MVSRAAGGLLLLFSGGCALVAGLGDFGPASTGGGPRGGTDAGGAPEGGAPSAGAPAAGGAPIGGEGGGPPTCSNHLLIAEIRTYGVGNGDDDFVEIYNPTDEQVDLSDVSIWAYKPDTGSAMQRWHGDAGEVVAADGRFVVGGLGFGPGQADATFTQSIGDSQIVLLRRGPGGTPPTIDHVCICTNDCGQAALWGGCPGVLPNPAWVGGQITSIPDSLSRVPDCIDTDTDIDFSNGPATPGEANR